MIWRFVRNRYGRAVYEWLMQRGITFTVMLEYHRDLGESLSEPQSPVDVTIRPLDVDMIAPPDWMDDDRLDDADVVVAAMLDGDVVGAVFASVDRQTYVEALEAKVAHEGAYVWRLYVDPDHRNRGIATAIVTETLRVVRERFDVPQAVALVALDNRPSQWVFEAAGFEEHRTHTYVSAFGRSVRRPAATS